MSEPVKDVTSFFDDDEVLFEARVADDAVSLCERLSRRYGMELTLDQARILIEEAFERE